MYLVKENIVKKIVDSKNDPKNVTERSYTRARRRASKVMYLYFKYMFEVLLEKKVFYIPNFGTIKIVKRIAVPNQLGITPRHYKGDTFLRNERFMNKRMIGETVSVEFIGIKTDKRLRFRIAKSFRKNLTKLLYETDYGKTIPLCQ